MLLQTGQARISISSFFTVHSPIDLFWPCKSLSKHDCISLVECRCQFDFASISTNIPNASARKNTTKPSIRVIFGPENRLLAFK